MIAKIFNSEPVTRRFFNKVAGATALMPTASMVSDKVTNHWLDCPEFFNLYKTPKDKLIPMTYKIDGISKNCYGIKLSIKEKDHLALIPYAVAGRTREDLEAKLNEDSSHTILAAATDRNMIVYNDNDSNIEDLFYDMRKTATWFINKHEPMHFFLRAKKGREVSYIYERDGRNQVHPIKSDLWDQIEEFYLSHDKLGGVYPEKKNNLAIGVKETNQLIHVKYNEPTWRLRHWGYEQDNALVVLSNQAVILGAY